MRSLKDIGQAAETVKRKNHSMLIYGPPKTGKSVLVSTAAALEEIENIYWIDLENGVESLLHQGYSPEVLDKIKLISLPDTSSNPIGIETILRLFSAKSPVSICYDHGKVNCVPCKDKENFKFHIGQATHKDLVVIDSGSQLGASALAATMLGKDPLAKPGWDEYGIVGKWLADILSVIQQCQNTNFVMITHEISLEGDDKVERFYPLMGTKNFSMTCAKYFGTVVYTHIKVGKHVAGSSSTYRSNTVTGSRVNAILEKASKPDMRQILVDGGILKPLAPSAPASVTKPSFLKK